MKCCFFRVFFTFMIIISLSSCSTVKVVPEGEYRLKKNSIIIPVNSRVKESELVPYIRQKPNSEFLFGWNPFLSIYNWSNGTGNGWDRFVTRLGQAPVLYDSTLVDKSNDNIISHLESLGYYNSTVNDSVRLKSKLADVTYYVYPGKRYSISSISYDITDDSLRLFILSDSINSLVKKGNYLSEKNLEAESERVTLQLRDLGYYNFTKSFFFLCCRHSDSFRFCKINNKSFKLYKKRKA